jgi:hypothetical protein
VPITEAALGLLRNFSSSPPSRARVSTPRVFALLHQVLEKHSRAKDVVTQAACALQSIASDNSNEEPLVAHNMTLLALRALFPVTLRELGPGTAESALSALRNMVCAR